jgi:hypothetical protein
MARYIVIGSRPQFGHEPGTEFEADLSSEMEQRAIARNGIRLAENGDGLSGLKREELNALADEAGVADPEKLGTKAEVIEAIEAATKEPAASGGNQEKEE